MKNITKIVKKALILPALLIGMSSCSEWLSLKPQDQMVLDDYWQDAAQVEAVVGSCYRAMIENPCMERMMIWGELRSDNFVAGRSFSTAQKELMQHNILTSNAYAQWSSIYTVINYCNTVLYYAPGVMDIDANFTEGELKAYQSEALAIRSLMYFYLVRTFRDVPLILIPSKDDTENFAVTKDSASVILKQLISDLKTAKSYAMSDWDNARYNKGRLTKQSIRALLADVYLWNKQYTECIQECDEFLQYNKSLGETDMLKLVEAESMYSEVFNRGNSSESIFELQFDDDGKTNTVVNSMFGTSTAIGWVSAPNSEGGWEFTPGATQSPYKLTDIRGKDFFLPISGGYSKIFKFVGASRSENQSGKSSYTYRSTTSNWILYRLSDIFLMRAEALAQSSSPTDWQAALYMVNQTYMRANPDLGLDSLKYNNYSNQTSMQQLVLDERQREFAFEGKRWFDLVRLSEREQKTSKLSSYVLKTLTSDNTAQTLAKSKLSFMDALYMPIHQDEISANPNLKQNPFYITDETVSKN